MMRSWVNCSLMWLSSYLMPLSISHSSLISSLSFYYSSNFDLWWHNKLICHKWIMISNEWWMYGRQRYESNRIKKYKNSYNNTSFAWINDEKVWAVKSHSIHQNRRRRCRMYIHTSLKKWNKLCTIKKRKRNENNTTPLSRVSSINSKLWQQQKWNKFYYQRISYPLSCAYLGSMKFLSKNKTFKN